ncbi:hypothetical protein GW17_00023921 [Ensete ventricosum]|nr:hypothetical protein GW17_00023921 [Ensete ventricosum]RZS07070.1 hypothetical protein BHM03_00037834 [Ensete ventricosum]
MREVSQQSGYCYGLNASHEEFYGGSLEDGETVKRVRPWHSHRCFGPFYFFDIDGAETRPSGSGSWVNEEEIEFIVLMYHKLATYYPELRASPQVAVISPYSYQVKLLRQHFRATFGDQSDQIVDINTVDGFQVTKPYAAFFSDANLQKMQVDLAQQKRDLKKAQTMNAVHDEMTKMESTIVNNPEENAGDMQDYGMDDDGGGGFDDD